MNEPFLSSEGRISRPVFVLRIALLAALAFGIVKGAIHYFDHWHHGAYAPLGVFVGIVASAFCVFAGLMQLIKRLHDMGKGPFWSALLLLPGVNVLFLLYAAVAPACSEGGSAEKD